MFLKSSNKDVDPLRDDFVAVEYVNDVIICLRKLWDT